MCRDPSLLRDFSAAWYAAAAYGVLYVGVCVRMVWDDIAGAVHSLRSAWRQRDVDILQQREST